METVWVALDGGLEKDPSQCYLSFPFFFSFLFLSAKTLVMPDRSCSVTVTPTSHKAEDYKGTLSKVWKAMIRESRRIWLVSGVCGCRGAKETDWKICGAKRTGRSEELSYLLWEKRPLEPAPAQSFKSSQIL